MEIDFATYEQSFLLKELGFDRQCYGYFYKGNFYPSDVFDNGQGGGYIPFETKLNLANDDIVARPLFQQAFRWINDELRKYKNDFDINNSKFYIDFEAPHQSLNNLINLLLKIKESEELNNEDEEVIAIGQSVVEKSIVDKLKSGTELIIQLKKRLEATQNELQGSSSRVKVLTKNLTDVKTERKKFEQENIYLNEEVEKLLSLNKKNTSEIHKLKTSLVSLSNTKDKLDKENSDLRQKINILSEVSETLDKKVNSLELKISTIYYNFAEELMEEISKLKYFLWIFDPNKKERKFLLNLAVKYYKIAETRGLEKAEAKIEEILKNKKLQKYLKVK